MSYKCFLLFKIVAKTQMIMLAHIIFIIEAILRYKGCSEKFGGYFSLKISFTPRWNTASGEYIGSFAVKLNTLKFNLKNV